MTQKGKMRDTGDVWLFIYFLNLQLMETTESLVNQNFCKECQRVFGLTVSRNVCGKCANIYCSGCIGHPSLEIKLIDGKLNPDGEWTRVCTKCYSSRPDNDSRGFLKDLSHNFYKEREKFAEERELEVYRLDQRLEKLMNCEPGASLKDYEQSVVPWQKDEEVKECRCGKVFEGFFERKHHCRLCGFVVCSRCSTYLPIRVSKAVVNNTRVCLRCDSLVMRRKEKVGNTTELEKTFGKLMYFKEQINALMPRYEELLEECRERRVGENELRILYMETSAARDTLMLQFLHLESSAKNLRIEESSNYDKLLRENIYKAMQLFLQRNLLKLQMLPSFEDLLKVRKEQEEALKRAILDDESGKNGSTGTRAFIKQIYDSIISGKKDKESELGGVLLANLRTLLNKNKVLREQEEQLQGMLNQCETEEDKTVLREALVECQQELQRVTNLLNNLT